GGGMSSRLFVEVREKRGLAYMIQSAASCFRDAGMTYVRAGLDPASLKGALQVIKEEIQKISEHGVTDRELKDAKNNISGRMALSMEESNAQAEWFAKQFWFMNKIESPDQMLNKIKKVTAKQVQAVAKQLFDFDQMRVAAIGPLKKENILKML
ncbi:insulinase family protein, partial [Patescibacteria group bacterium]|nr:insulinase family protein [Patescibacteria group bacterium]